MTRFSLPAALLLASLLAPAACAQYPNPYPPSISYYPHPPYPNYGGGYRANGYCSGGYCVPSGPPFQGMLGVPTPPAGPAGAGGTPAFPVHPFARSPRDYFMFDFDGGSNPYRLGYISSGSGVNIYQQPGIGGDYAPLPGSPPAGPR